MTAYKCDICGNYYDNSLDSLERGYAITRFNNGKYPPRVELDLCGVCYTNLLGLIGGVMWVDIPSEETDDTENKEETVNE